ncbi:MAG: RNA 2',3'-cyclic phosphodiesterase [Candidatus Peribacteraceae bacterium]|jgi:2'-5' RNA ligase
MSDCFCISQLHFPLSATFLALPLEEQPKWQFQALQEELKDFENCLRFQNPQTPHVTLYYWQEVMEIEYQQIHAQAQKIAAGRAPFTMRVTHADTFGSRGEDRVLLLEVAFSEELARLKKSCPWPDGRPFHPHITLARISHPQRFATIKKKVMKALDDCAFAIPVDRLRLYAEIDGRKQTPLEDYSFSS